MSRGASQHLRQIHHQQQNETQKQKQQQGWAQPHAWQAFQTYLFVSEWSNSSRYLHPIAFGVSFLHSRISIDNLVLLFSTSHLPRSVAQTPRRLRLEIEIKWHSKCNRLYLPDGCIGIVSESKKRDSTFEPLWKDMEQLGTRSSSAIYLQLLWMSPLRPPPSRHPWRDFSRALHMAPAAGLLPRITHGAYNSHSCRDSSRALHMAPATGLLCGSRTVFSWHLWSSEWSDPHCSL